MSYRVYLTTVDNPYNPSEDFKSWFAWDIAHQYNTCQLIDRMSFTSSSLSDRSNISATERAIDEIIRLFGTEIYKKIVISNDESDFLPKNQEQKGTNVESQAEN